MANSHLKELASNQPGQKSKMTVYPIGYNIQILKLVDNYAVNHEN